MSRNEDRDQYVGINKEIKVVNQMSFLVDKEEVGKINWDREVDIVFEEMKKCIEERITANITLKKRSNMIL